MPQDQATLVDAARRRRAKPAPTSSAHQPTLFSGESACGRAEQPPLWLTPPAPTLPVDTSFPPLTKLMSLPFFRSGAGLASFCAPESSPGAVASFAAASLGLPASAVTLPLHAPALQVCPLGHPQSAEQFPQVSLPLHVPSPQTVTHWLFWQPSPVAQAQSAQHVAADSLAPHWPSPQKPGVLQPPAVQFWPLGQPQSPQQLALVSPASHVPLPQLGGNWQTPLLHWRPVPQPQSAAQEPQSSFISHTPLPHGLGGAPQSAAQVVLDSPLSHLPLPQTAVETQEPAWHVLPLPHAWVTDHSRHPSPLVSPHVWTPLPLHCLLPALEHWLLHVLAQLPAEQL